MRSSGFYKVLPNRYRNGEAPSIRKNAFGNFTDWIATKATLISYHLFWPLCVAAAFIKSWSSAMAPAPQRPIGDGASLE